MAPKPGSWKYSFGCLYPRCNQYVKFCKVENNRYVIKDITVITERPDESPSSGPRFVRPGGIIGGYRPSAPAKPLVLNNERFAVRFIAGTGDLVHGDGKLMVRENLPFKLDTPLIIGNIDRGADEVSFWIEREASLTLGDDRVYVRVEVNYDFYDEKDILSMVSDLADGPLANDIRGEVIKKTVDAKVEKLFIEWASGPWKEEDKDVSGGQ